MSSSRGSKAKRLAVYLFYDEDGIVDDYIPYKLQSLKKFVEEIYFVSNSNLTVKSRNKIKSCTSYILCRKNEGFDVWGYKEAIELIGYNELGKYDELILLNYTFFAPIFPFSELFDWSEKQDVGFWGISDHAEIKPNPFTGSGILNRHIQSHFIAIRNNVLTSFEFKDYWQSMPMINSYEDSVLFHESRFTHHFFKKGFGYAVYIDSKAFKTAYPAFLEVGETLKRRSPIFKRRLFFHDAIFHDSNGLFLRRSLEFIENNTQYDSSLILKNILRTVKPKDLFSNLSLLKVFDSHERAALREDIKILVVAHIFYPEVLSELAIYLNSIPCRYDLLVTTATQEAKVNILANKMLKEINADHVEIRIVEQNRGRDMSSLFITAKDIILEKKYDWVCRLHSKKSPQDSYGRAEHFKEMMYLNLLKDKNYTSKLLNFLDKNTNIGFAMPPMVHIGYPTLGHSWYGNKIRVMELAEDLGIDIPLDDFSPYAAYGTMFWFRPKALEKLFKYDWKFEDFAEEPAHFDGSLAHALERLLVYVVHDAGYMAYNVMSSEMAELNYTKLEYKAQRLMSSLPNGDVSSQIKSLEENNFSFQGKGSTQRGSLLIKLTRVIKADVIANHPFLAKLTRYPYRKIRLWYHVLRARK